MERESSGLNLTRRGGGERVRERETERSPGKNRAKIAGLYGEMNSWEEKSLWWAGSVVGRGRDLC